jgi:poly(A) polymerase Pap1
MQEIDLNKASWNALFEPFHFFEAYRKFLVVDIVADDDDDLRLWKGWVESRLRQLTLKVHFEFLISASHFFNCFYFFSLDTWSPHKKPGYLDILLQRISSLWCLFFNAD